MDMRVLSHGAHAVSLSLLYQQSGRLTCSVLSKCSATRIVCGGDLAYEVDVISSGPEGCAKSLGHTPEY
jgi:hypothetical protein